MNYADVSGISIYDWKKVRREIYGKSKTVGMMVAMGVECGMTPLEIVKSKVNNIEERRGKDFTYGILRLDEGCKGIRRGKLRDRTEKRERTVVLNSRLYDEVYYYTIDRRGKDIYIFQSDKHRQGDGLSLSTIEQWYKDYEVPFKPHAIKNKRLGARHLHKYLVESVCVEKHCYSERQIELHLGHIIKTAYVNYGAIPNLNLIATMVEETFVNT